ncbi:MAG: CvpA family protein [Thalassobaculaceae bacterium]|nr:CvpA family protein [Thalassobaculaceae bacterium]
MDSLPINITDLAVITVLVLSGLLALMRGFVAEVFSIVAWAGALAVGVYGYKPATPIVEDMTGIDGALGELIAGGVLFIAALIIFMILARLASGTLQMVGLGAVDRSLGFLFGLLRGAVLVCVAYLLVLWAEPDPQDHPTWLTEAKSLPLVVAGSDMLVTLVPDHLRSQADTAAARARRDAEDEAREALKERLLSPTPKTTVPNPGAPASDQGYTDKERQELNRAIQSTQ